MVDLVERVVDLVRVLEDHLDIAQKALALLGGEALQILSAVEHLAAGRRRQPQQQARQRRLAAAALAHDRRDRRRLGVDPEREIVERYRARRLAEAAATEDLGDVSCLEQCRHALSRLHSFS